MVVIMSPEQRAVDTASENRILWAVHVHMFRLCPYRQFKNRYLDFN